MPRRTTHEESSCPVARPLDVVGDGWTLLIVRDAFDGLSRFGQFQKNLGLAKNILSARLAGLVAGGVFETAPASDGSPYQEYVLTEKGRALFPVVTALRQWGEQYFFESDEPRARLVDRVDGAPIAPIEVRAADGRMLGPDDAEVLLP
ncbi:helix-turn-helix domain-containing protein [Streptomyces sp. BE20]|uniref:winged helix-turn-helix transcriptional regulator n=1 Tax=Streptomycetaceae TaxID=2062 RepID=UPI002E7909BA|nr:MULTISPECIES: helix-turn-helix domain-containing protein [unclassified Streptomyces]MED7953852.1 helix-turn-helix domain-containing protein [Streptomyces sp. BE303]MEE1825074.1 helix-turn-helix domain-containing protein [Streptomyces sp. BE20]